MYIYSCMKYNCIRWQLKQPFHFCLVHSMPSKQVSNSVRQSVWQKLPRVISSSFNRDSVSPNGFSVACRWSQMVFIKPQYIHNFSFLKVWNILLVPVKEAIKRLIQRLRRLLNILTADFNNSFIPLFVGIIFDTAKSQTCNRMDAKTATNRSIVANFTGNLSLRPAVQSVPLGPEVSPFDEFFKFAFGSAIYIIIASFVTVLANGLLLVVFFFDPLKTFRTATTYFLISLAFVDILTAASQEPMYATCFIMMYLRHPDTLATCTPLLNVGQVIAVAAMNASFLIVLAFTITQYKRSCKRSITFFTPLHWSTSLLSFTFCCTSPLGRKWLLLKVFKNTRPNKIEGEKINKQERKFIIINFLLIAILFLTSQPSAVLWIYRLYSNEDPNTPRVLIVNLMLADNLLYLKFLLDPFVYAWRIPRYRRALKYVMRCGREEPEETFSDRVMAQVSKSRETVVALDFKCIKD